MNKVKKQFSIANEFTMYPGPRYKRQGEYSGEKFFEDVLEGLMANAIEKDTIVEINLDGTAGYASSFIDEAFGNLVFKYGKNEVVKHLTVISELEPDWKDMIFKETIPEWEQKRLEATNQK